MKISFISLCLIATLQVQDSFAQFFKSNEPFAHTYSIVARDPKTGEMAAAVQSHWFSVGSSVIWGKSGVGVVATQSFINPAYGPNGLGLMANGLTAKRALIKLISEDAGSEVRQVAFLDNNGDVASFTGELCIDYAGNLTGDQFSVQSNMMLTDKVPEAMKKAFEDNIDLPLAERVLSALQAAQNAGGDIRGKQSAALIVVSGEKGVPEWQDKLVDLRVEDHENPVEELTRLLKVHRAYGYMNAGDLAVEHGDFTSALKNYGTAMEMFPDNQEMKFWTAVSLVNNHDIEKAKPLFKEVFASPLGKQWKELLGRLPKVNQLNVSNKTLNELLKL